MIYIYIYYIERDTTTTTNNNNDDDDDTNMEDRPDPPAVLPGRGEHTSCNIV